MNVVRCSRQSFVVVTSFKGVATKAVGFLFPLTIYCWKKCGIVELDLTCESTSFGLKYNNCWLFLLLDQWLKLVACGKFFEVIAI